MNKQNCRAVYGKTLVELGMKNERIVALDADLSKSTMTCLFEEAFPERHFEMGIGEQNMVSVSRPRLSTTKCSSCKSLWPIAPRQRNSFVSCTRVCLSCWIRIESWTNNSSTSSKSWMRSRRHNQKVHLRAWQTLRSPSLTEENKPTRLG